MFKSKDEITISSLKNKYNSKFGWFKETIENGDVVALEIREGKWAYIPFEKEKILEIIVQFKSLRSLIIDIDNFCFKDLSPIKELIKLEHIEITCNTSVTDFSFLESINNLTHIELHSSCISQIEDLSRFKDLDFLCLSHSKLSDLSSISNFKKLTQINFKGCKITDLGKADWPDSLIDITLSDNQIKDVSPLTNCSKLKNLNLNDNLISDISKQVTWREIEDLNISNNKISDLSFLQNCKHLEVLDVSSNTIFEIEPLKNNKNISSLYMGNNQIANLTFLNPLEGLKYLNVSNCQIKDCSPLRNLTQLRSLDISNNTIEDISSLESSKWTLDELDCSNNQIKSLEVIKQLKGLTTFNASYNQLEEIRIDLPETLYELRLVGCNLSTLSQVQPINQLYRIDLSDNQLTEFPYIFPKSKWVDIRLKDNCLNKPVDVLWVKDLRVIDLRGNPFGNQLFIDPEEFYDEFLQYLDDNDPLVQALNCDVEIHIKNYYNLLVKHHLDKKNIKLALAYYYNMKWDDEMHEFSHIHKDLYIEMMKQTPDGEGFYIKFCLYRILSKSNFNTLKNINDLTTEEKEVVLSKIKTIEDDTLRNQLIGIIQGELWADVFRQDQFPGFELMTLDYENVLEFYKGEFLFFKARGMFNPYKTSPINPDLFLYYLQLLYKIRSPFFYVLNNEINSYLNCSLFDERLDKYAYNEIFIDLNYNINTKRFKLPESYSFDRFQESCIYDITSEYISNVRQTIRSNNNSEPNNLNDLSYATAKKESFNERFFKHLETKEILVYFFILFFLFSFFHLAGLLE